MSSCVGLVYFQSLVGLRLLGVNGEKKLMETGTLLIKLDSTFYTGKPWHFNSLREVNAKRGVTAINILQMICIGHALEAPGPYQQTLLQTLEWKTAQQGFIIIA